MPKKKEKIEIFDPEFTQQIYIFLYIFRSLLSVDITWRLIYLHFGHVRTVLTYTRRFFMQYHCNKDESSIGAV